MKQNLIYLIFICFFINKSIITAQTPVPIPVHQSFTLESSILKETRTINVWLPPTYTVSADSFPVLYMLDGGIKEDFPHIANTLAELIAAHKIPSMLLVGIENTQRRRDLTGSTEVTSDKQIAPVVGGSTAFRQFINDELFPAVDTKYKCNKKRAIIGESLAGLFIIETMLIHPEMFDYFIAMDPSLWWNDHYLPRHADQLLAGFPDTQKRLWFAGSRAKDILIYTEQLADILKTANLPNLQWTYVYKKHEKHNTIFRKTKVEALEWMFTPRK